jgi:hypothetical protein
LENSQILIKPKKPEEIHTSSDDYYKGYKPGDEIADQVYNYSSKNRDIVEKAGKYTGFLVGILTAVALLFSLKYGFMLIKLYQLLEFLIMMNLTYPTNVVIFLKIFQRGNPLNFVPNFWAWLELSNNHCDFSVLKFIAEDDLEC